MQIDIQYRPGFSLAVVSLDHKEKIQVESGAMVSMSPDIEMETEAKGGFLKSIARKMFGGESFWMNTYTGAKDGDRILLAPPLPGDIVVVCTPSSGKGRVAGGLVALALLAGGAVALMRRRVHA